MLKTVRVLIRGSLWQYLAVTLGFVVITVGGVALFGSDNLFGTYLIANSLLCMMFYLMSGIALGSIWPGLCLSMGATRRQFYAGVQLTMLLGLAGYLAVSAGTCAAWRQLAALGLADEQMGFMLLQLASPAEFLQTLGILTVFGQLGLLMGFVSQRSGKLVYVICMVLAIIFCINLYLAVALSQAHIFTMPLLLQPAPLGGACLALALGAGAGSAALMRKYAV